MPEGLDAIDWSILTHAHGPAVDVPALLRSLLSRDPDVRLQPLAELVETIWHQGTVYPASAAAIPFLFASLTRPDVPDPDHAASLLGCIATGEGWLRYGLRVDGEQALRRRLAGQGRSLEEAPEEERAVMEAIHRDVAAGREHLLPYLNDRGDWARSSRKSSAISPSTRPGRCRGSTRRSRRGPMSTSGRCWPRAGHA